MIIEGIVKLIIAAGVYKISTGGDMRYSRNQQKRIIGIIIVVVLVLWAIYDFLKAARLI